MTATAPECPACGAPLRLTSDLTGAGLSRSWACTDGTCPTIIPEDKARALSVRDDLLGAPVEDLMRAPVTPQGGGGGNGRSRRQPKPGDRAAREALRERRYLDQEPAGGRDREVVVEPVTMVLSSRIDADLAADVVYLQDEHGLSASAIVRLGIIAYKDRCRRDGYPCPQCQFWLHDQDRDCPQCGG